MIEVGIEVGIFIELVLIVALSWWLREAASLESRKGGNK